MMEMWSVPKQYDLESHWAGGSDPSKSIENVSTTWPVSLSLLECHPAHQKVVDSIPSRAHTQVWGLIPVGAYVGDRLSLVGCMREAAY